VKKTILIAFSLIIFLVSGLAVYQYFAFQQNKQLVLSFLKDPDVVFNLLEIDKCRVKSSVLSRDYVLHEEDNRFKEKLFRGCQDKDCILQLSSNERVSACSYSDKLKNGVALTMQEGKRKSISAENKFKQAKSVEVIVVAGYEGKSDSLDYTDLYINRPNVDVMLVLSAHEKHDWNLYVGASTNLLGVVSSNYSRQSVKINIKAPHQDHLALRYVTSIEGREMLRLLEMLNNEYKVSGIANFYGGYTLENEYILNDSPSDNLFLTLKGGQVRPLKTSYEFNLITSDLEPVLWTINGPQKEEKSTDRFIPSANFKLASKDAYDVYTNLTDNIYIQNPYFGKTAIDKLPKHYPGSSNPLFNSIATDARNRLVVLGGEAVYYFDLENRIWLGYERPQLPKGMLTYDAKNDRYIISRIVPALEEGELYIYDKNWSLLGTHSLKGKLVELRRFCMSDDFCPLSIDVVADGDDVAFLLFEQDIVTHIWNYNLKSKMSQITYKNPLSRHSEHPFIMETPSLLFPATN
jgi:hypothetical protein